MRACGNDEKTLFKALTSRSVLCEFLSFSVTLFGNLSTKKQNNKINV